MYWAEMERFGTPAEKDLLDSQLRPPEHLIWSIIALQDCDIVIPDKTCSRVHACLAYDKDGRLHIADLNSVHGESCATHLKNAQLGLKANSRQPD